MCSRFASLLILLVSGILSAHDTTHVNALADETVKIARQAKTYEERVTKLTSLSRQETLNPFDAEELFLLQDQKLRLDRLKFVRKTLLEIIFPNWKIKNFHASLFFPIEYFISQDFINNHANLAKQKGFVSLLIHKLKSLDFFHDKTLLHSASHIRDIETFFAQLHIRFAKIEDEFRDQCIDSFKK